MKTRAASLTLAALMLAATPLAAQTVEGAFVDPAGQPVAGARAVLRDAAGREIAAANTGRDGGFVLRAPAGGTFVLRIERIGYGLTESAPFALADDQTVRRRVTANAQRIALQGIVVQSRSRCTPRPGSGPQTATVWEEARKVLGSARESAESGDYRYAVRRFWRQLDAPGVTILYDSTATAQLSSGTPFMAVPLDRLSREGYVEPAGGDFLFHAPDARVLLSDEFQERHCFALVEGQDGLIGLSFEPVSNARPDVRGTLWLDRATAELRRMEYRYTRVPGLRREADAAGGQMEFTRMPDGRWIVGRWSIRMPLVTATRVQGAVLPGGEQRLDDQSAMHFRLSGIREEGGEVLSAARADEAGVQLAAATGTLTGTVFDSTTARPLAGARVSAAGHVGVTDSLGRFSIPDLPAGDYQLGFTAPALDALHFTPSPVRVTVLAGAATEQALAVPPLAVLWAAACDDASSSTGSMSALVGVVRGAAGQPSPGARVAVSWAGERPGSTAVVADSQGVYRVCDAPAGVPLTVRLTMDGAEVSVSDVRVAAGRPRREDLALPAPRTAAAASAASSPPTGISGIVRDAGGRPLAGATVRMDALSPVQTDAQGRFRLRSVTPGEHRVVVTHPSIGSREVAVRLPGDAAELELRAGTGAGAALAASVQRVVQLAGIGASAQARRPGLDVQGFYNRQRIGLGVFLTDERLQRVTGRPLSNVLRMVSGVSILSVATEGSGSASMRALAPKNLAASARGSTGIDRAGPCLMDVYLDGALVAGPTLGESGSRGLDDFPIRDLEAVEVYRGGAEMPAEYRSSTSTCGVILLWTRR